MSNKALRQARIDKALVWAGLIASYLTLGGLRYGVSAAIGFALVAIPVSGRLSPSLYGLLPLLATLAGVYPLGDGVLFSALLLAGPVVLLLAIGLIGAAVHVVTESKPGMERAAAIKVVIDPLWWLLIAVCAALAVVEGGLLGAAAIVVPALLVWQRHLALAAIAGLAAAALTGWPAAPLILAGVAAAAVAWRSSARPPELWHPFPRVDWRREPRAWLRMRRCDRRIRGGDLLRARSAVGAVRNPTHHDLLRLAFLDVEERSYQRGLALAPGPGAASGELARIADLLRARAMSGIAQFEAAGEIYARLLSETPDNTKLATYLRVLLAENSLAAGDVGKSRTLADLAHGSARRQSNYFLRLRADCVLAEGALVDPDDPVGFEARIERANDDMLDGNRWIRHQVLDSDPTRAVRQLFGRRGNLHLYFVRVEALTHRGKTDDESGWEPEAVAIAMGISGWSDDMVELLLTEARIARQAGREDERARLGIRALMELDATRYRLAAQSARTSWSRRLQRALAVTLDAASETEDHTLVAELLEFARVQALPATTAEAAGNLALSTPPVVRLRELARLARPGDPNRPAPVSLEAAAVRAAGEDGWWLSFWEAEEWLYWALVPPASGEIVSGRRRIGGVARLSQALQSLEAALPLLQPGEEPASADFRIAGSPLLSDPDAERALSAELASLLIPEALALAVRQSDEEGERLSLAISPSPSLGYVPWGILALARSDHSGHDRLLELCDWVIAPSAALLVRAPGGDAEERVPLALAVADTTATRELEPLAGARAQAGALPPAVTVLGGRHWSERTATVAAIERKLREAGPGSTAAFMCHAVRGTPDEPSRGGLVIDAGTEMEVLSPVDLFEMTSRGVPMPAQVLLQACDTSALSDGASGEWLTLAPALIAGGSREVIATLYPTPDLFIPDDPVIASAVAGTSLREAVVLSQRVGLARWEAGRAEETAHTPLSWAAYAPICVGPHPDGSANPGSGAGQAPVSTRFLRLVADAIGDDGKKVARLQSGHLLSEVLEDSEIAFLFDGGGNSLAPSTFLWTLGPYVGCRYLRFRDGPARRIEAGDGTGIEVPELMLDALSEARAAATRDGVMVEPEHLLLAALERPSGARRTLGLLSALSRRPPELTKRAILHHLADAIARGQKAPAESAGAGSSERQRRLAAAVAAAPDPAAGV